MDIRFVAPFHNHSGYAKAGRAALAALLWAGHRVQAIELEADEVWSYGASVSKMRVPRKRYPLPDFQQEELTQALHTTVPLAAPTLMLCNPTGFIEYADFSNQPRIGWTMLEADTLCPLWAQACRNVDLLCAPSLWCYDTLKRDVTPPCDWGYNPPHTDFFARLPLCVDERQFPIEGPKSRRKYPDCFNILAVFSLCERKHWRLLMQAFTEEFMGEDVALVLLPNKSEPVIEMAEWCKARGAKVEVLRDFLSEHDLSALYRSCDAYALPSVEGFGLPFVEAMMHGLPTLTLAGGGAWDTWDGRYGISVPTEEEPCIGLLPQIYHSEYMRPTCTIEKLRLGLRRLLDWHEEFDPPCIADLARENWGREAIAPQVVKAIEQGTENFHAQRKLHNTREHRFEPPLPQEPLTVIMTTCNRLDLTERAVKSLRAHTSLVDILLADDNSEDGTLEWAVKENCRIVQRRENCVYVNGVFAFTTEVSPPAHNVSFNREVARRSRFGPQEEKRFLAFMDNDIEVTPGWWEEMQHIFRLYPQIGLLAPVKFYPNGKKQNVGRNLGFDAKSTALAIEREIVYPHYVESACFVLRPEVWPCIEWDAQFPIFYEDVDICYQVRRLGWEVASTNLVSIIHDAHSSSHDRRQESEANRMKFLRKWKADL